MRCAAEDLLGDDSEDDEDESPSNNDGAAQQPGKPQQSTKGTARTGTFRDGRDGIEPGPGLQEEKMEILT